MRKLLSILPFVVAIAAGVALAAQLGPLQIIAGETRTEVSNGQTLRMTSVGVTVSVEFSDVSSTRVAGRVWRTGGASSGTFTITWVNRNITRVIDLSPSQPERLFSLEGGDGDKRDSGQVGQ